MMDRCSDSDDSDVGANGISPKGLQSTTTPPIEHSDWREYYDVAVNAGVKAALKREWDKWFHDGMQEYTSTGNRKRPSYQAIINMVSAAVNSISPENVKRAFECCGVGAMGATISEDRLNQRLQQVLSWRGDNGIGPLEETSTSSAIDDVNEDIDNESIVSIGSDDEQLIGSDYDDNNNEIVVVN